MKIKQIEMPGYEGMIKIIPENGAPFYLRKEYLQTIDFDSIQSGAEFSDEESNEILDAAVSALAEFKAISYLARCEQNHFNLSRKLCEKGLPKKSVENALNYLEEKKYLSDERFARAWLNQRKINHFEGPVKLQSELNSRGITREVSKIVIDEFFNENDELEICRKAYEKFIKKGKSEEKLTEALLNAGFSYKRIKEVYEKYEL